jgi:hypothetical protein
MPREYSLFVFARLVVALALVWAVCGTFLFSRMMHYLGWDSMNVERQMMLFGGLSLVAAIILAFSVLAVLQIFQRRRS